MRELKPKADVVVRAAAVSQVTVQSLYGVDARRYLDVIVPRCRHVAHVGRLRVVAADEMDRVLRELAVSQEEPTTGANQADEDLELASVDAVLAKLGRRRIAGGKE